MKKRAGRPLGRVKKILYYEKAILERLAEVYPESLRFTDLKIEIPNPRTLTDYLRRMEKNNLLEIVINPKSTKGTYRITKAGIQELLKIRTCISIPKTLAEPKLQELSTNVLHTSITLNLIEGKTQKLQGLLLLPYEDIRKKIEQRWKDENFVKETCRMLHSVLHFRAEAPAQVPFAKHIEGTNVFIFRPPNYIFEDLQKLVETNPEIPNLDAAICYALESWFRIPETIKNKFPLHVSRGKNKLEFLV